MTPEQQTLAIAEACGWKLLKWTKGSREYRGWKSPEGKQCQMLPDYTADLNAMHKAEKTIFSKPELTDMYVCVLMDLLQLPHALRKTTRTYFLCMHATAEERSEAFLRTLNLWTTP